MRKITILLITFIVLSGALSFAQAPEKQENLVYAVAAYNGKDYTGTFVREGADTIYLIGEEENFLNIRKTLVYYWPITQEWKADYDTLNENLLNGKIELKDQSGETTILDPVKYTYYNFPGEYEINWKVFTGDEADREYEKYQKMMDDYWAAVDKFQRAGMEREIEFQKLITDIGEARKAGRDVSALVARAQEIADTPQPEPPARPSYYVRPVDQAYLFQLKPGRYSIRFITDDGFVMEGSEKNVVVHKKRRENGVGYEVIPADKWTRPEMSQSPSSVLYVNGQTDLYIRPFYQDEFNDLYYNKTVRNDSKGNPGIMNWIRIQQIPKARVEMIIPKEGTESIDEKPYYVEQLKGSALGYKIVPFDPEGKHKDREPSLRAYHVPIRRDIPVIKLKLQDKENSYLPSGVRQIRIITDSSIKYISLILAFIPVVIMVFVLFVRSRRYE